MNCVTLISKDSKNPILAELIDRNKSAAIHDGKHYAFAEAPEIEGAIDLNALVDEEGIKLTTDALVWLIAKDWATDEEDSIFQCTLNQSDRLYKHPAWQIWCGNYSEEDSTSRDRFKSHWEYISSLISVSMPEAAASWPAYSDQLTYEQGRQILLTAIGANS